MKRIYEEDQKAVYGALREKARKSQLTRWEHLLYAFVRGKTRTEVESRVSHATDVFTNRFIQSAYRSTKASWYFKTSLDPVKTYIDNNRLAFCEWLYAKEKPHVVFPVEGAAIKRREEYHRRKIEKSNLSENEVSQ
jgi:hypothetical protein